ncbi:MAG: helix-turn-helix transcriptional regulator [Candidatus Bipolaricaulota bacterium]
MRFGNRLRELRTAAGMTQQELADALGVSSAYISAIEGGRKPAPPRAVVEQLARALRADHEALWETALAEREERLRQRLEGVPTSLRVEEAPAPVTTPQDSDVEKLLAQHPELEKVCRVLASALNDTKTRARALAVVDALVRGLSTPK